jgi:hypothetical protein
MINSFFYCVENEVFIYLVADMPQASTFNMITTAFLFYLPVRTV